jgi:cholesterol oxidase
VNLIAGAADTTGTAATGSTFGGPLPTDADVCVVGSGFGGGPVALRAAQAGASVVVLEQGKHYGWKGDVPFQQTQADLGYLMELFNIAVGYDAGSGAASIALGGRGLGGGSLIYSMVSLRAPSFVFDEPAWPDGLDRAALDPYYARAEEQLEVVQLRWSGTHGEDDWRLASKRDAAFAASCERAGVSAQPVPVAVNQRCANLGWCTMGCVRGSKNSVDRRYIQPAADAGAVVRTQVRVNQVRRAAPGSPRRWRVVTDRGEMTADTVVLSAGAVGTPALLLHSRAEGGIPGGLSAQVGRNLSRGGDMITPVVLAEDLALGDRADRSVGNLDMEMLPGKIIGSCSFQYLFEPPPGFDEGWPRFVLQPMMVLPMISSMLVADPDGRLPDGDMRLFGEGQKHLMRMWGDRLLHIGVMGMDGMDGRVTNIGSVPQVVFHTSERTRQMQRAATAAIGHIFGRGEGGRALPGFHELRQDSIAIHPLGSVRMADSHTVGATDRFGRVYRADGEVHEGLYVSDSSLMSSPIAVNTSLTTAALAERVAEHLVSAG